MPSKAEFYRQMAEQVSTRLVGSWQEWTAFLSTAARLYKYPFHEQMMIYAQRPDATACAEYDLWNEKMGRYVRRGSKGIALVDDSGDRPRLRYVFDISDTGTREHSRTPWLWQLEEQHIGPVSAMLERNYGIAGDDLAQQLTDVAGKLASEYWDEHQQDFRYIVDGSFLEEYDDLNVAVQFKSAATVSIAYALMSRCGLEPERYFQHEDFMSIFDFNTPATVGALGAAVSQINQQVLRQIGVTIQNYEREHIAERSITHGEQPDLHEERRLPDSRSEPERAAEEAPGQVRQDAESVPEGTPSPDLQPSADEREAVPAPAGDRENSEQPSGADDASAGGVGGRDGGTESPRSDALGGPDEHLQGTGRGNPDGGAYQQLTLNLFLSEAEQIQRIDEAENVKISSAFSFTQEQPQPEAANQEAEAAKPTLRELHEKYKPIVLEAVKDGNGNVKWSCIKISRILRNATYMGYLCYNKSKVNNFLEKRRIKNLDEDSFILKKGAFEPIISEALWHQCENIRNGRIRKYQMPSGEERRRGTRIAQNLWVKKLRCRCGAGYNRFKWRVLRDGTPVYGYQCNYRTQNPAKTFVEKNHLDSQKYCDAITICEWKLDLMAKMIFDQLWGDQREAVLKACQMIESCILSTTLQTDSEKAEKQKKIEKLEQRLLNLGQMRADGELTREQFQKLYAQTTTELDALKTQQNSVPDSAEEEVSFDLNKIKKGLSQMVDITAPRISEELIDEFVEAVTPVENHHYRWKMTFGEMKSGQERYNLMEPENSPVLSFTIDFETARQYRMSNGLPAQFRQRGWTDLNVEVYL